MSGEKAVRLGVRVGAVLVGAAVMSGVVGARATAAMADPPPTNDGEQASVHTGGTVAILFK